MAIFLKRMIPTVLATLSAHSSLLGFDIINLTDSEKVVQIQEAYRPQNDKSGNLGAPIPIGYRPYEVSIPANSIHTFPLRESCPILLVSMITSEKVKKGHQQTVTTSTTTTCYEPYDYQNSYQTRITNEWGIVIHKPIERSVSFSDPDYGFKSYIDQRNLERGYGIKCLHPKLLEKTISLKELPEELTR